nr:MAG TPA: hypothetical protein [Caudoviricetes sp.]
MRRRASEMGALPSVLIRKSLMLGSPIIYR